MIISRTPFRISFFGGGTDYPAWYEKNGGSVLSTTIDKYCYITCRYLPPFFDHKSRIVWSRIESVKNHNDIQHPAVRATLNFLKLDEGIEIHHDADLPARAGLGSSSSFVVGLLNSLSALKGRILTKRQLALDAIHIEQKELQESVGSQDQAAAAFGGFNKIDFGGPHGIMVTPITIGAEKLDAIQDHFMLFFTGLSRTASEIAKEQLKNTNRNAERLHRMNALVGEAISVLSSSSDNLSDFGRLLDETWKLKRSLAANIASHDIDTIYSNAMEAGALGGKLLGAGGGGFILFFVPHDKQQALRERLKHLLYVPFRFENLGSQIVYYGPERNF